jgi:hypothetical protein
MTVAAPTRATPAHKNHTTPIGTGELHQALEASRDLRALRDFCSAYVCTPDEVSSDGGKSLNVLRVLDLMRRRGYGVSDPTRPQHQPKHRQGLTTWLVDVTLPTGARFQMGFYTPST